jgi:hypothetical protein
LTTWKLLLVLTMLEIDSSSEDLVCDTAWETQQTDRLLRTVQ